MSSQQIQNALAPYLSFRAEHDPYLDSITLIATNIWPAIQHHHHY